MDAPHVPRAAASLAVCAALLACATPTPGPAVAADPASRVKVERLAGGTYSIRPVTHACRTGPAEGRAERLVALAEAMWVRFGRKERPAASEEPNPDAGIDTDAAIAGFWASIPPGPLTQEPWREWREDPVAARDVHWSAAFTSWLMCEAGLSQAQFVRSPRHRDYVVHARDHAEAAHRPVAIADAAPLPGDLLCANKANSALAIADIPERYPLHCFLVVEVSGGEAHVVGGYVDGAVAKIPVRLAGSAADARVVRTPEARWLLLMKLRDPR